MTVLERSACSNLPTPAVDAHSQCRQSGAVAVCMCSAGGVTYTWDDNGNLTSDGVRTYDYDHANRLTQVTDSLTTQFAYNGDGVRISKTVDETTNDYVLDLAATLPVVISDTDAVYLYGLDIIAQQQAERHYYMHDGLGRVRQLGVRDSVSRGGVPRRRGALKLHHAGRRSLYARCALSGDNRGIRSLRKENGS